MASHEFMNAKAVWAKGMEDLMNIRMGFSSKVPKGVCRVDVACAGGYQLFVNDKYICAGPARAAHGFYKVDSIDISGYLNEDSNYVALLTWGYRVNSYSVLDQASFITAEIICDDLVIAATGDFGFNAYLLEDYVRKIQRYTYQRAFVESYKLSQASFSWMKADMESNTKLGIFLDKKYLKRDVPYPEYEKLYPRELSTMGDFEKRIPDEYRIPWYLEHNEPYYKAFEPHELEEDTNKKIQNVKYDTKNVEEVSNSSGLLLKEGKYNIYAFERETTGMIKFKVTCKEPCDFMMVYDEQLTDGYTFPIRIRGLWVNSYVLEPGEYELVFFEPVSMKYLNLVMLNGQAFFEDFHMVEYKHPPVSKTFETDDKDLLMIYEAAVETYRQNTLDIYMDCPSRERAGWLCDSFFTSRVEYLLTGKSVIERSFLNNFLLPDSFEHLPKGMLPMCYPADHPNGRFIPNWAMWLVIELYEYLGRTNDRDFVDAFKSKVYGLCEYFEDFINKDGLLQDLKEWVFVEWSHANNLVQNVNFPTNMLYAFMLERVSLLYDDKEKLAQAEKIRNTIREVSFNGQFFRDRMVLEDGKLEITDEITEVCQYYAFFTKTASIDKYPELWEKLLKDFGPDRAEKGVHPEIYGTNAFIGTYLRLELLSNAGLHQQLLDESVDFFLYMAKRTGTLWENKTDNASLNHGFASHVVVWFDKAIKALKMDKKS